MEPKQTNRSPAMDVIRCVAFCCVAGIHFFLRTGYYYEPVSGPRMYLMTVMRSAFMVCVPLFLMLSGYLTGRRRPTRSYYAKLGQTLGLYVLATLVGMAYRRLFQDEAFNVTNTLTRLLNYLGSQYGWYIEMYIGLFLLAPYINILYDGLKDQSQRRGLVLTLLFCTALPSVVNIYNFSDPAWWRTPSSSSSYFQIMPAWWEGIYPLTYYVLGMYLRDYPLKLRGRTQLVLLAVTVIATGSFAYYRSVGSVFVNGSWQKSGALPIVIQSVLLFSLLSRMDYGWMGPKARRWLAKLSGWCLGAYLLSWMFDYQIYDRLNACQPDVQLRLNWFPLTVPVVIICSFAASAALNWGYNLIARAVTKLAALSRSH